MSFANYEGDYDLVGISTVTPSAPYAYEIADKFKDKRNQYFTSYMYLYFQV